MHAHLQVIVTSRQACVLGSMCLVMMILIGFAGVAPHQVPTLALPQITQQTQLVVSIKVRIFFKTVALHEVSNPFHLIWNSLVYLAIFSRFHQQIFFPFSWMVFDVRHWNSAGFTTCSAPSSTFLRQILSRWHFFVLNIFGNCRFARFYVSCLPLGALKLRLRYFIHWLFHFISFTGENKETRKTKYMRWREFKR